LFACSGSYCQRHSDVYKEGDRYRATLYNKLERIDLGFFDSAEDAAIAYNEKSQEIFGRTKSLNKVEVPSTTTEVENLSPK
jgi:hypothetical protein